MEIFSEKENKKSTLRTKEALLNALLTLVMQKSFDEITVSNIIQLSGYSRTTFYNYYEDKYDMIEKIIDEEAEAFVNAVCNPIPENIHMTFESDIYIPGLSLFEHVEQNKNLYYVLIHNMLPNYSMDSFCQKISKVFEQVISIELSGNLQELDFPLYCYITSDTYIAFIKYWELHNFSFTPKYMARQMMTNWVRVKKVSSVSVKKLPSNFNTIDI